MKLMGTITKAGNELVEVNVGQRGVDMVGSAEFVLPRQRVSCLVEVGTKVEVIVIQSHPRGVIVKAAPKAA